MNQNDELCSISTSILSSSILSLSLALFLLFLSLPLSLFLLWVSCLPLLKAGFFISEYFSVTAMSILCSTFILFVDFSAARFTHFLSLSLSLSLFLPYQKVRKEILTTDIHSIPSFSLFHSWTNGSTFHFLSSLTICLFLLYSFSLPSWLIVFLSLEIDPFRPLLQHERYRKERNKIWESEYIFD